MTGGPLAGCRVLVTRPGDQADELCRAIEDAGGVAIRFPVMRIVEIDPADARARLLDMPSPDIVVFVSRNAARFGLPLLSPLSARIAAIGPATQRELEANGQCVDIVPDGGFDSEHLLAHEALGDVGGRRILIVRGEDGRELLGSVLAERGATVHYLPVYRRECNPLPDREIERLEKAWQRFGIDCVSVMSVATLEFLLEVLPPGASERLRQTPLVAPGDRVIQKASELLPGTWVIKAAGPRPTDIVDALIDWRHSEANQ